MPVITKSFSINDVQMYKDDVDVDFAEVEIWALAEGNNSHRNPISKEVLEKYADTFKGKFIVAEFDKFKKDVTTHTIKECIIGYIDPNKDIEFKNKEVDGQEKEFVVLKGLLSKIYATEVIEMFKDNNNRTVSCEFSCQTELSEDDNGTPLSEDNQPLYNTDNPILKYHIHGITILGMDYKPSVKGTEIKVKRFAEQANKNILKDFAEKRKQELKEVSHPIDKSKDAVDMGDWNGDKAKKDLVKEKKYKTLAKSVCLLLEDGWENREVSKLKYPVMCLKDEKWVYNKEGLSSALAYSAQHDKAVYNKVISIQKKLGLFNNDKEETMEKEKQFVANITDLWGRIYDKLVEKFPDKDYGSLYRIMGIYESNSQKFAVIFRKEEDDKKYRLNFIIDENDTLMLEDEMTEVTMEFIEGDTVKSFSDEGVDPKFKSFEEDIIMEKDDKTKTDDGKQKEKTDTEDKKFSLDAYLDVPATLEMLKDETDENKKLADKVMKDMSANDIMNTILTYAKENKELKEYKTARMEEDKTKQLNSILASVKCNIDDKTFEELKNESKDVSFENVGAFANKVKAVAYDAMNKDKQKINTTNEEIMSFAASIDYSSSDDDEILSAEDIFNKYN